MAIPVFVFTINLNDGNGNRDITALVLRDTIRKLSTLHNNFQPQVDSLSFSIHSDAALFNAILAATSEGDITVTKDGADYFTGTIRTTFSLSVETKLGDVRMECIGYGDKLQNKMNWIDSWVDYKVSDATTKTASIVHQLLVKAGFDVDDDIDIPTIDKTIDYYVNVGGADDTTYWDAITQILIEFGYVWYFDASGVFKVFDVFPASVSTSDQFNNNDMIGRYDIHKREEDYKGVRVFWYPHETADKVAQPPSSIGRRRPRNPTCFSDTTGGDDVAECGIEVVAGGFYPEGAGTTDIYAEYQFDGREIIVVNDAKLVLEGGSFATTFSNEYLRAKVSIENTSGVTKYISKFNITGAITYKGDQQKNQVLQVVGAENILEIDSRFITDTDDATKLASGLSRFYEFSDYLYIVRSKTVYDLGDIVDIVDQTLGINNRCLIYKIEDVDQVTNTQKYYLYGITAYTVEAVTLDARVIPPPPPPPGRPVIDEVVNAIEAATDATLTPQRAEAYYPGDDTLGAILRNIIEDDNDITLNGGAWFEPTDYKGRRVKAIAGGNTAAIPSLAENVQTIATVCHDQQENKDIAASYQFRKGNETKDSGFGEYDLTVNGTITYVSGPWGTRLAVLNGTDAFFSDVLWVDVDTNSFTIFFTFNADADDGMIAEMRDASDDGFYIYLDASGNIEAFIGDGTNSVSGDVIATADIDTGQTYRGAVVWNRASEEMIGFLDGVEQDTVDISSVTGGLTQAPFRIGNGVITTTQFFDGKIGGILPVLSPLSADDISTEYALLTGAQAYEEETKVNGPIDGNQSAAFHGGIENELHADQDLTGWTDGAEFTVADVNENYKGYPLYSILVTGTSTDYVRSSAIAIGATEVYFSMVIKNSATAGVSLNIGLRNSTGSADAALLLLTFSTKTATVALGTFDDYGVVEDGEYLIVWGIASGLTSGQSHQVIIKNLKNTNAIVYAGLTTFYVAQQRIPFNLESSPSTAHNETGIEFYPRNGMVGEGVFRNDVYSATAHIFWAANEGASVVPAVYGFVIGTSDKIEFRLRDGAGTVSTFEVTIPTAYRHEFMKWVVNYDTTSQTSGSCTIYYGYNPTTGSSAGSVTENWTADPSGYDWSLVEDFTMSIGSDDDEANQFNGPILYTTWSHPDDPSYYFKREWNRPWGDYVEKPNMFEGVGHLRHVRPFSEFQVKQTLDWLTRVPGGGYDKLGNDTFFSMQKAFNASKTFMDFLNDIAAATFVENLVADNLFVQTLGVDEAFINYLKVKYLEASTGTYGHLSIDTFFDGTKSFTAADDQNDVFDWFVTQLGAWSVYSLYKIDGTIESGGTQTLQWVEYTATTIRLIWDNGASTDLNTDGSGTAATPMTIKMIFEEMYLEETLLPRSRGLYGSPSIGATSNAFAAMHALAMYQNVAEFNSKIWLKSASAPSAGSSVPAGTIQLFQVQVGATVYKVYSDAGTLKVKT